MPSFTVSEPHPTVATGSYTHSGRGGAGNYFRAPQTTPAAGVPVAVTTADPSSASSTRRFYSGRGGAGNAKIAPVAPLLDFSEECARVQSRQENTGYVGRGGAGNFFTSKKESGSSSRRSSNESDQSLWARISGLHH